MTFLTARVGSKLYYQDEDFNFLPANCFLMQGSKPNFIFRCRFDGINRKFLYCFTVRSYNMESLSYELNDIEINFRDCTDEISVDDQYVIAFEVLTPVQKNTYNCLNCRVLYDITNQEKRFMLGEYEISPSAM